MPFKIHHLNCATLCPTSQRLINGDGGILKKAKLVCHCLLVETNDGLVLVDTGFSFDDITKGGLLDKIFFRTMGAVADPDECALTQVRKLGFKREDVRHIIVTHLDRDHAGGIKDFPDATVHVFEKEWIAGNHPQTAYEHLRYSARDWRRQQNVQVHRYRGEIWEGFESVQVLSDALYDILVVPLVGHSRGHCGIAVSTTEGWLLHCGDAYMHNDEIALRKRSCPIGLEAIHLLDDTSRADRLYNQDRLRNLKAENDGRITVICSHDHNEFDTCRGHSHTLGRRV